MWRTIAIVPWRRATEGRAINPNMGVLGGVVNGGAHRNIEEKVCRKCDTEPQPMDGAPGRGVASTSADRPTGRLAGFRPARRGFGGQPSRAAGLPAVASERSERLGEGWRPRDETMCVGDEWWSWHVGRREGAGAHDEGRRGGAGFRQSRTRRLQIQMVWVGRKSRIFTVSKSAS